VQLQSERVSPRTGPMGALSPDELEAIRDGNRQPLPCGGCGCIPRRQTGSFVLHYWHNPGCPVAERIRQQLDDGD
jgi:hypothetical protein